MKAKKIIAVTVAAALLLFILYVANGLLGNPISQWLVNRAAKAYIAETYPDNDFVIEPASYSFKFGEYIVHVSSASSIDTRFSVTFSSTGKLRHDDYKSYVTGGFNTWERLEDAYRKAADLILKAPDFPYPSDIAFGTIDSGKGDTAQFELDKEYDLTELGKKMGTIILYVDTDNLTPQYAAQILTDIKALFDAKSTPFAFVNLTLNTPLSDAKPQREYYTLEQFPYAAIGAADMEQKIMDNVAATKAYYAQQDKEKVAPQAIDTPK